MSSRGYDSRKKSEGSRQGEMKLKGYPAGRFPHAMTVQLSHRSKPAVHGSSIWVFSPTIAQKVCEAIRDCRHPISESELSFGKTVITYLPRGARFFNFRFFRATVKRQMSDSTYILFLVDLGEEATSYSDAIFDIHSQSNYVRSAPMAAFRCVIENWFGLSDRDLNNFNERFYLNLRGTVSPGVFRGELDLKRECHPIEPCRVSREASRLIRPFAGRGRGIAERERLALELRRAEEKYDALLREKQRLEMKSAQNLKEERELSLLTVATLKQQMDHLSARASSLSAAVPLALRAMDLCAGYAQNMVGIRGPNVAHSLPEGPPPGAVDSEGRIQESRMPCSSRDSRTVDNMNRSCPLPVMTRVPANPQLFPQDCFTSHPRFVTPRLRASASAGESVEPMSGTSEEMFGERNRTKSSMSTTLTCSEGGRCGCDSRERSSASSAADAGDWSSPPGSSRRHPSSQYCAKCRQTGHTARDCPNFCTRCKRIGHTYGECPFVWKKSKENGNKEKSASEKGKCPRELNKEPSDAGKERGKLTKKSATDTGEVAMEE